MAAFGVITEALHAQPGFLMAETKILCVEADVAVQKSRCAVLKVSGYDTVSASPQVAETVLRSHKFDLVVLSVLSDYDRQRIINFANGAEVLVLDGFTMPLELLRLVADV